MGIFGGLCVPSESLAFAEKFEEEPSAVVEVDRCATSTVIEPRPAGGPNDA